MNDMNIKKKKKRGIVDTIAAVHILQNYLDAQRNKIF
jgi:RNase H-fold protein (predicted Holliday junction resolvase)